ASQKIYRTRLIGKPLKGMNFFETPAVTVEVEDQILFIRIFSFAENSYSQLVSKISELDEEAREFESIVLDLRFNPGGSFQDALRIASLFLPETQVGSIIRRAEPPAESINGSEDFDPEFDIYHDGLEYKQDPVFISPIGKIYTQPMIVLANEHSASSADILTQILSENKRAYFVGTRTFGKGIGQFSESLGPISKLGGQFKMTMMQFVGPSGYSAQVSGVYPNYELPDPLIEQLIEECKRDKSLPCAPTKMSDIAIEDIIQPIPSQFGYCDPIPHGLQTYIPIHEHSSLEISLKTKQSLAPPQESFDFQKEAAKELLRLR
ncbi:MAG: S41 family peptidase, partial [Bdellovibrionota bacterium]